MCDAHWRHEASVYLVASTSFAQFSETQPREVWLERYTSAILAAVLSTHLLSSVCSTLSHGVSLQGA